jgi:hypothetical protein
MQNKFGVLLLEGFVNVNTLSPNEEFYYKIKHPREEAMSMYAADLAFFDNVGNILYCSSPKKPASFLPPFETFNNIIWLLGGTWVFFVEYERNRSEACVLDLRNNSMHRKKIDREVSLEELITLVTDNLDKSANSISNIGFVESAINRNEIMENYKRKPFHKWYPIC